MAELTQDQQVYIMLALESSISDCHHELQNHTSDDLDDVRSRAAQCGLLKAIHELGALYELVADADEILIEGWPAGAHRRANSSDES